MFKNDLKIHKYLKFDLILVRRRYITYKIVYKLQTDT